MTTKHAIHADFAKLPGFTLKFKQPLLGLINTMAGVQCFFTKRSLTVELENHRLTRADGSTLKLFTLSPPGVGDSAPALIYYHGGGFGITYAGLHVTNCQRYAIESGCKVIFVEYRLAPKRPFPYGFDDCYQTLEWTLANASKLGIDRSRIAVGGDSAGGALAAGVAQKARDENLTDLCGQLLIYPVTDNTCSTQSATQFVDVPVWNAVSNRYMWDMYLKDFSGEQAPAYAAPGHGNTDNLSLCYVETAEFDPLRDEGRAYTASLKASGVDVVEHFAAGAVHGYDAMEESEVTQQGMQARVDFLRQAFCS
ncbi:MAG: alpha/beta hydrolase [Halioglobus sp.]